ncbi:hypothetical protein EGW08_000928 [Elysia chlorotica]|uniref:Uncharacterized protein n=1 Tax=Elysia chlorotica TaxID=188477 RepID=A0A433UC31_ELYCH|nr:hypothetical protein EGW08_000928 [Elysia chlorotica]
MNPKVWIVITLTLLVLTTALHIAGLVAPWWIYLKTSDFVVGVGLFFRVGCEASSRGNCTHPAFPTDLAFRYNEEATYDEPEWKAVVWLETISAAFALVLCIMMIIYLVGFGVWRKMGLLNMTMALVCGITWLVNIAGLIVYIVFYGKVITRSSDVSKDSFPWSVLMVFLAAVLFLIINILIRLRCRNRNYLQHAIPTSADSKMALNPSTKSQVMKRYFTPSPYREDRRQAITNSSTNPAITSTEQSRDIVMAGHQQPSAPRSVEHVYTNGHLRLENGYQQDTLARNVIQTQQIRPGVSTPSAPPTSYSYVHQKSFNTDVVIKPFDDRPRNRQEVVIYQQPQIDYHLEHHQEQQQQQQFQNQRKPRQQQEIQTVTTRSNQEHFQPPPPLPQQFPQQQQKHQIHEIQNITTLTNLDNSRRGALDDTHIDNYDSETIFYKGGGDVTVKSFSFVPGVTTDQGQRESQGYGWERRAYTNGGFATEDIGGREEQVTAFRTTQFLSTPQPREVRSTSIGSFRIGAEHQDLEPFRELGTTHMRRTHEGHGRVLTGTSMTSGKGHQYNSKFMYRPYSEQSY